MQESAPTIKPIGRFQKAWLMTKSAWGVLKMKKSLTILPVLSAISGFIVIALIAAIFLLILNLVNPSFLHHGISFSSATPHRYSELFAIAATVVTMFVIVTISNFASVALISSALTKFRGGDQTLGASIKIARSKTGSIVRFSLLQTVVGTILNLLSDRLPFIGRFIIWLGGMAWSTATVFALPVIADAPSSTSAVSAVKQSTGIIKRIWGESLLVTSGVGILGFLGFMAFYMFATSVVVITAAIKLNVLIVPEIILALIIGALILAVITTLSSIASAAVYYYATTGESPVTFEKRILQAALTPKKARRIFGA